VCIYIYIYIYIHTHTHTHTIYIYIYIYIYILCVCVYTHNGTRNYYAISRDKFSKFDRPCSHASLDIAYTHRAISEIYQVITLFPPTGKWNGTRSLRPRIEEHLSRGKQKGKEKRDKRETRKINTTEEGGKFEVRIRNGMIRRNRYPNGNDSIARKYARPTFSTVTRAGRVIYLWRKAAAMPSKCRINSAAEIYARVAAIVRSSGRAQCRGTTDERFCTGLDTWFRFAKPYTATVCQRISPGPPVVVAHR